MDIFMFWVEKIIGLLQPMPMAACTAVQVLEDGSLLIDGKIAWYVLPDLTFLQDFVGIWITKKLAPLFHF